MALYGDFGEHEHIFSPVSLSDYALWALLTRISCGRTQLRRWLQKTKSEFWQLSPEEKRIVQSETLGDPAEVHEGGAGQMK